MFLGLFLCTLFYSFTEASFRMMNVSWFFLLLVIVAGSQAVLFRSGLGTRLTQEREFAADENLAYATQGVRPGS
jgi:hypothetical protein